VAFSRLDSLPECSSATVDFELGAFESTKLMIERGHRRIAMLKALSDYQPGVERYRGYMRALDGAGIAPDMSLMQSVSFRPDDVANAVHRLLKNSDVTALVDASGTEDGANILEGARRAGRKPGGDFEVLCWTYTSNSVVLEEACMHLWLPIREATTEGLELLADWYFGKRMGPIHIIYPPTMLDTKDLLSSTSTRTGSRTKRMFDSLF
jgi:DNA-binding LacI/PurR family transcriptional regulator